MKLFCFALFNDSVWLVWDFSNPKGTGGGGGGGGGLQDPLPLNVLCDDFAEKKNITLQPFLEFFSVESFALFDYMVSSLPRGLIKSW